MPTNPACATRTRVALYARVSTADQTAENQLRALREHADRAGWTIVADEAYLRESIEKPDARIVKGFEPMMPPIPIPPADLKAIVEYLETLH